MVDPSPAEVRYLLREAGKLFIIRQRRRQLKGDRADRRARRKELQRRWRGGKTGQARRRRVARVKARLLQRQGGKCPLCNRELDLQRADHNVDHIQPIALGGRSGFENLRLVHIRCHKERNTAFEKQFGTKLQAQADLPWQPPRSGAPPPDTFASP